MKRLLLLLFAFFTFNSAHAANKEYQAIDSNGNVLFTIMAESVYKYRDGLARVKQLNLVNNQWVRGYGYINKVGELVIPAEYEKAKDFVDDRAWVRRKGESNWTLINKEGIEIPTKGYSKVGNIIEGYSDRIAVYEDGKMGWIDRDGNEVIPCKYLGYTLFDKEFGLVCVMPYDSKSGKYGYIDKNGEVQIPFQFLQAGFASFHNGYSRATVGNRTVLINEKGEVVFRPKYGSLQNVNYGLMAVATKSNRAGWGFINFDNEMVIPAIYDNVNEFNELGYCVAEKKGLSGLIDTTGKMIIDFKYDMIFADLSDDGYYCGVYPTKEPASLMNTPKDYYNAKFELVELEEVTLSSANGSPRIGFTTLEGKKGFMNRDFEIIIEAKYAKTSAFSDGIAFVRE